jgi:type VI secretion system protein ImpF
MSTIETDQPLVPSLLDRLIDEQPDREIETPASQNQILSELRQTIRRDLENLLNTRRPYFSMPEQYPELERSVVNYGIPDLIGLDMESAKIRNDFLKEVEEVIRYFEPRFLEVKVISNSASYKTDRTLKFRIEGQVQAYPAPEPIVFDSELEPSLGQFSIERIQ